MFGSCESCVCCVSSGRYWLNRFLLRHVCCTREGVGLRVQDLGFRALEDGLSKAWFKTEASDVQGRRNGGGGAVPVGAVAEDVVRGGDPGGG